MGFATALVLLACGRSSPETAACGPSAPDACLAEGRRRAIAAPPDLATAAEHFARACDAGLQRGCVELGLLLQDGRGIAADPERARALYDAACAAGEGVGCLNLAFMYQTGNGPIADDERAVVEFGRAFAALRDRCTPADTSGCVNLGYLFANGFGVAVPDPRAAQEAYTTGCAEGRGDPDACTNLAAGMLEGTDTARAIALLTTACDAGSGSACGALGRVRYLGQPGVASDLAGAMAALDRGCALGHAVTCSSLGAVLTLGQGIVPDPARAEAAEERGCALGDSLSCVTRANVAISAAGGPSAPAGALAPARPWLEAACRIGDAPTCVTLGTMVRTGAFGSPDPEAALDWFARGCRLRGFDGCAELLLAGRPLPLESRIADTFLEDACRNGLRAACLSER